MEKVDKLLRDHMQAERCERDLSEGVMKAIFEEEAREAIQMERLEKLLHQIPPTEPSAHFADGVMRKVAQDAPPPPLLRPRIAAALLLFGVLSWLLGTEIVSDRTPFGSLTLKFESLAMPTVHPIAALAVGCMALLMVVDYGVRRR